MRSQRRTVSAPPGMMVDLDGLRLHAILCGSGAPVVIFEPALGGFALQYAQIQTGVTTFTSTLAYDRAGQGWSDPSPNPRTPANLAAELAALLERLSLQPPYVLVGHSFGGLLARYFACRSPQAVAGMVLVDASHEDQNEGLGDLDQMLRQATLGVRVQKLAGKIGLGKALARLSLGSAARELPRADLETFITIASQPRHQETMLAEFAQHRCYYGPETEIPRVFPPAHSALPLVVVSAGSSVSGQKRVGSLSGEEMNTRHLNLQKTLVGLSTAGEQVIVPDATHLSLLTQPAHTAQVVAAIRRVVELARAAAPP